MTLLHPAALFALVLLAPLVAVEWRRVRREQRAARALGLRPQPLWRALRYGVCAGLVVALAAVAAAEPTLRRVQTVRLRSDAEVYVFLDASASMLARASSTAPTRLEQARQAAAQFARALPGDLPLGAGALPQAPLPLTAPIGDRQLFLSAIDHLTTPGTLPEHLYGNRTATNFGNLAAFTNSRYFLPQTRRRIVVVLSDGEGPSFDEASTAASLKHERIHLVFVRFGSPRDRIWLRRRGRPPAVDANYVPDLTDLPEVRLLARDTGGAFYGRGQVRDAIAEVDRLAGHGPDRPAQALSLYADPLGQYLGLAALPFLAWLAGALLPFSLPLGVRARLRRRSARRRPEQLLQRGSTALSNQE